RATKRLNSTVRIAKHGKEIFVLDSKGTIVASSEPLIVGQNRSNSKNFMEGKKGSYFSGIYFSPDDKRTAFAFTVPVLDKDTKKILGVIVVQATMDEIDAVMEDRTGLGKTGEIYLVNKEGYMITPSRFKKDVFLKQKVNSNLPKDTSLGKDTRGVRHSVPATYPDYRGVCVLGVRSSIQRTGWELRAEIDEREAMAPLRRIQLVILIVLFSVPAVAWLTGIIISRRITAPLHELHEGAELIGKGNLDHKVGTNRNDEIGQLSRAFDKMAANLQTTMISVTRLNDEITHRTEVEKKLKTALQIKADFTARVSHELRTPLTAIKEGVALVLDGTAGKISDEQKNFLGIAKRNVDRLARIINNVLDFQKLDDGRMLFDMRENDMNESILAAREQIMPLAETKGLHIQSLLDKDLPKIQFDRDMIMQVLTNLLSNAVKYTEKGTITVSSDREGNLIRVSVNDTGCGVKKDDLPRLFLRFEQLESLKDRKTGGTGLGLAIARQIITSHKGRIWAESEPGKGSTFHFTLPIKERRR
ncbi:MAG: sensor histidine kinase, partial [Candidatus Omnitrophota bacterium]